MRIFNKNNNYPIINTVAYSLTAAIVLVILYFLLNVSTVIKQVDKKSGHYITKNIAQQIKSDIELKINTVNYFSEKATKTYFTNENLTEIEYLFNQTYITQVYFISENNIANTTKKDTLNYNIILYKRLFDNIKVTNTSEKINKTIGVSNFNFLKNNKKQLISEPFIVNIENKDKVAISIYKSITKNNEFIGVIGVDFILEDIEQQINMSKTTEYENVMFLVSDKKNIISVSQKAWMTAENVNMLSDFNKEIYTKLGEENSSEVINNYIVTFYAINLGDNSKTWFLYNAIPKSLISRIIKNNAIFFITTFLLSFLMVFLVIRYFLLKFLRKTEVISNYSKRLSDGEIFYIEKDEENDSTSEAINSLSDISENNYNLLRVIRQLIDEKFDLKLKLRNENSEIPILIKKISSQLINYKTNILQKEKEFEKELWTKKGRDEIYKAQRESNNNLELLAQNITRRVVNYSDAIFGAMYFNNNNYTEMIASYAYSTEKHIIKKFKPGEGLIGACVLSMQKIEMDKIPDKYSKITSGLGSGKPKYLIILPIIWQNSVLAVLELAYMQKPDEHKMYFIDETVQNIGSWLNTAQISSQTEELLNKSQVQTNELHDKENELTEKINELEKIQTQYSERSAEMESMINAVNNTVMSIEYTVDGMFIKANNSYFETMGYQLSDLEGKSVIDIVEEKYKQELFDNIENVKKGNLLRKKLVRTTKQGKEKELFATYTPYYDKEGKVTRIIFFALDMSDFTVK